MCRSRVKTQHNLAIYIHVPFCGQRCHYCHFDIKVLHPRSSESNWVTAYVNRLMIELENLALIHGQRPVHSVYFGGGTPSRLPLRQIGQLLDSVRARFQLLPDAEITLEANPEDVHRDWSVALLEYGVTRLSLGVQSFEDEALRAVRRPHNAAQVLHVLGQLPVFPHGTSLDLMVGLPHQTLATVTTDLDQLLALDLAHVSLYLLDRELPTALDKYPAQLMDDDQLAAAYGHISETLTQHGYEHYEISNFARPGYASRHNQTYWRLADYLGVGPAAHGFLGNQSYVNETALSAWMGAVDRCGVGLASSETWSAERIQSERMIQGLRRSSGVPWREFTPAQQEKMAPFLENGMARLSDKHLSLTRRGWLLSNEVFVELCY